MIRPYAVLPCRFKKYVLEGAARPSLARNVILISSPIGKYFFLAYRYSL